MAPVLAAADICVVVLYFLLVLSIGLYSVHKARRTTVSGFFLAGRSMTWAAVGASLFVSNIGSEHFIGLAGSGAAGGYAAGAYEFNALVLLQLLGWVFIPVYIHSGVYTMPEYLSVRYGGRRLKVYFAALSLALYVFTKLSVDLYSGALFVQESLGWNLYLSMISLITLTALLTVTGGLMAVIYTDTLQAVLMIAGAVSLSIISVVKVGGLEALQEKYMQAIPNVTAILASGNFTHANTCHIHPKPLALKLLRGPSDEDTPWPGFLLGQTPASIWYWCADQVIVQKILAAKNISHAKGSTLMAGLLKVLPMFVIVIPGMISRILFTDEIVCISPEHCTQVCGSQSGCYNIAYPRLVMNVMPTGLRGLMMAVMIAALMSDLDSIFNSASTIFTLDIYKTMRTRASPRELVMVGRLFVVLMVAFSIMWVPLITEMHGGQMYLYIQEVSDYLTPSVAALFLLGVLCTRCNETGAFWGGVTGSILGISRLILAFIYKEPLCDQPDGRPAFIVNFHFMYVAAVLFWTSGLVAVAVSICTPAPSREQILTTTLWGLCHRKQWFIRNKRKTRKNPAVSHKIDDSYCDGGFVDVQNEMQVRPNVKLLHSPPTDPLASSNGRTATTEEPENRNMGLVEELRGVEDGSSEEARKCWKMTECLWRCEESGPKEQPKFVQEDEENLAEEMLYEPPKVKLVLNTGLLLICTLALFFFVYFSV